MMKQKAMQTTRAESLFFTLCAEYGYGEQYEQLLPHHTTPFTMRRLRRGNKRFRIGIDKQEHLVTVCFFDGADDWRDQLQKRLHSMSTGEDVTDLEKPAVVIYGGRLCPAREAFWYPEVLQIKIIQPARARFLRILPLDELFAELGISGDPSESFEISIENFKNIKPPCLAIRA